MARYASTPRHTAPWRALAAARGVSVPEIVKDAMDLMLWFDGVLAGGGSIVVRSARGPQEIVRARR